MLAKEQDRCMVYVFVLLRNLVFSEREAQTSPSPSPPTLSFKTPKICKNQALKLRQS